MSKLTASSSEQKTPSGTAMGKKTANEPKDSPFIQLEGICKSFGHVRANHNISLSFHASRITALLGENGSGKSTLMSILAGKLLPDSGNMYILGAPVYFSAPKDAIEAGIGMVYQHFMLVDNMTVTENIFLGHASPWLRYQSMRMRVAKLSEQYALHIDPDARIRDLSMGERQRVEILKLLDRNSRMLIFDEPTAMLTPLETEQLFISLKRMAAEGKTIVFISHKMKEVLDIADEICILRRGELVDVFSRKEIPSEKELAQRMIGQSSDQGVNVLPVEKKECVLHIHNVSGESIHNLELSLHQGSITAIAGVAGNGQQELVRILAGLLPPSEGTVSILGKSWADFYAAPPDHEGVAYIPEDRRGLATCPSLPLTDNFLITNRTHFTSGPFLDAKKAHAATERLITEYQVYPPGAENLAANLSGGNLQKFVIGREWLRQPRLIIAENPTQGLDIGATLEVWRRLLDARNTSGILLITGDLNEALTLADTVAIMYRGQFMDVFSISDTAKVDSIGMLMAGIRPEIASTKNIISTL